LFCFFVFFVFVLFFELSCRFRGGSTYTWHAWRRALRRRGWG
jgi:hypothetical protein